MKDKCPLILIAGPTASGKSDLAVRLAEKIGGEIISGDSMQVYKGMDIGTAKITVEEMRGIPHHLIDVVEPWEEWNVARFTEEAARLVEEIHARGAVPIVCGGTGFYLHALAYGADFEPEETGGELRRQLEEQAATEEGRAALYAELCEIDPESARVIHPNNSKRVIRAIEYYRQCGRKISEHNSELKQKESPYELYYFVLSRKREELYERIEQRVDRMMADGLVEEVKRLREAGCSRNMVSMQGLGYKEILDALDGITSLEEAVRILKRDTRHFAKRQLTWFRREDAIWIDMDAENPLAEVLKNISCRNTPHVV
ncbi:MAG: tRNA (adenosine(37)-N6)-dimethylallyltransferase MiaA [Firmicutes bacterium]|nr:tRNA (adenosine(37)-N6)-dimethylallyltransferase MiaA [Bacillota bacterium]